MELSLGMDDELMRVFCVKIKEQTGIGDIVMGVCCLIGKKSR